MNQYPIWIGLFWALVMACITSNPLWWMIAVVGIGANGVVVAANGWKMPVRGLLEESVRHRPMIVGTRHKWLGDIIPTGLGKASLGDFLLMAGMLGAFATRESFTYVKIMAVLCILWWASGWAKGFLLFEKWTAEARRECRKNLPIVLLLMLIGNLLNVRGCSVGELHASAKSVVTAIEPEKIAPPKVQPPSKWRDLGTLAPPPETLRRLREATAKEERDAVDAAIKAVSNQSPWVQSMTSKSARSGPFCRVTCAAHHGGQYDVETIPELCRAHWIPPNSGTVPGWYAVSSEEEITNAWPGPAQPGFENYKLYWSGIQSDAKVIHVSLQK